MEDGAASGRGGGTEVEKIKVYGFYNYDMGTRRCAPRLCCKHPTETRTSAPGGNASVRDQSYVRREELSRSFSLAIDLRADVAICAREVAAGTQQTILNVARVHTTVEIWSQELRIGAVEATFVIIVESGRMCPTFAVED